VPEVLESCAVAGIRGPRTDRELNFAAMFLSFSTLASLRFFQSAARLLSFKQAALELHVTRGAVSQQIKHLEEALGCKLFYRLPRQG
jgi:hypothetical protein